MPDPKSFLAGVKDEISECFAIVYDELAEITTDEEKLGDALKKVQKKLWSEVVEPQLKASYLNGKKSANGRVTAEERRPNPFRRER